MEVCLKKSRRLPLINYCYFSNKCFMCATENSPYSRGTVEYIECVDLPGIQRPCQLVR